MSVIDRNASGAHAQPPHLFTTPGPRIGPLVTVTADSDTSLVEIGVHGRWSRRLSADVSATIGRSLAEPPAGIIADLYDLGDPDAANCAVCFVSAHRHGTEPRVPTHRCSAAPVQVMKAGERAGRGFAQEIRGGAPAVQPVTEKLACGT
ncbi:hypothetical protein AB0C07_22895 [Actinoplanes missouriensis]|uniref:hypothetical protein n=1 Tax=Actinoplanes missouriensis TaxID=1866 RepID=UPI003409D90A